ncbi:retrovirus-related Pol polyprotein from transposon 297 [Trichonephila clavipes]|nr:retrovirus-related Pol polyprotein from transposon 297 [Trichonephila clavipes]
MFQIFKDKGLLFQETTLAMSLADDQQTTGEALTTQKEKLNLLLKSFQGVFEPGGEATNILEHHINKGNSPPISDPQYRMSPVKKEILRTEIVDLLEKDIIEEQPVSPMYRIPEVERSHGL